MGSGIFDGGLKGVFDWKIEVQKGNVVGHSYFGLVASQQDVGTTFKDLWSGGDDLSFPTTAETLEVVSTSTDDAFGGSNATEVLITSLAADGSEQTPVLVPLNGTTPVIASGTHFAVNAFSVITLGTNNQSTQNKGDITLRVSGGGAIRAVIKEDTMSSFNSHFTVPKGHTYIWQQSSVLAPKGEDVNVRPRFQFGGTGVFFVGGTSSNYQNNIVLKFVAPLALPAGTRILNQAKSTNVGTFVTTIMEFLVIDLEETKINQAGYYKTKSWE